CWPRQRRAVPRAPVLAQQESVQRRALEHLVGTAAAVVIIPLVADRVGISLDADLDVFLAVLFKQVHIYHYSQDVAHFVGDVYEKPDCIFASNNHSSVIAANLQYAAVRVRKTADPPLVLVPPGLLPFDVLMLAGP